MRDFEIGSSLARAATANSAGANGGGSAAALAFAVRAGQTGNQFLDSLPERVARKLLPHLREVSLAKNAYLIQQDAAPEWIYFPVSAIVSRYQILEDGRTIEVALTGKEAAVGLASSLGSKASTNCCQVCIPGKAYKIFNTYLTSVFKEEPQLNNAIINLMEAQIRQISKRLICSHFHSVEQRLCAWLLLLSDRCGGGRIDVTHDQTARSLGIHRPTVTAITQSLRARELITYARGRITIAKRPELAELACDCFLEFAAA